MKPTLTLLIALLLAPLAKLHATDVQRLTKPNIVFIIVDDLNGWIGCLNPARGAQTPQIDRLASRGTLFSKAHCADRKSVV